MVRPGRGPLPPDPGDPAQWIRAGPPCSGGAPAGPCPIPFWIPPPGGRDGAGHNLGALPQVWPDAVCAAPHVFRTPAPPRGRACYGGYIGTVWCGLFHPGIPAWTHTGVMSGVAAGTYGGGQRAGMGCRPSGPGGDGRSRRVVCHHTVWRRAAGACRCIAGACQGIARALPEHARALPGHCRSMPGHCQGIAGACQGIARALPGHPRDMRKVPAPYRKARGAIHDATGAVDRRPFVVCVPYVAGVRMRRTGLLLRRSGPDRAPALRYVGEWYHWERV